MKKVLIIIFFMITFIELQAQSIETKKLTVTQSINTPNAYSDSRLKRWNSLFSNYEIEVLLRELEADILSSTSHPFSINIWLTVHHNLKKLEIRLDEIKGSKLYDHLKIPSNIFKLYHQNKYSQLLRKYPIESMKKMNDYWSIWYFNIASLELSDHTYNLEALKHLFDLNPYLYATVWRAENFLLNKDILKKDFIEYIQASSIELNDKQFYITFLSTPSDNYIDRAQLIREWLNQNPNDSKALRHIGHTLRSGLKDFTSAQKAYFKAHNSYPYSHIAHTISDTSSDLQYYAQILCRNESYTLAYESIESFLQLFDLNSRDNIVEKMYLKALFDAGEISKAVEFYKQKSESFATDDASLFILLSDMYTRINKKESAYNFAYKAYTLNMDDPLIQLNLLQKGHDIKNYDVAQTFFDGFNINTDELRTGHFYQMSDFISHKFGDKADIHKLSIFEKALEKFPTSSQIMGTYSYYLSKNDQTEKALKILESSFKITNPGNWSASKVFKYTEALSNKEDALKKLHALVLQYPSQKNLWEELSKHYKNIDDTVSVYTEALEYNNTKLWPQIKIMQLLADDKEYDKVGDIWKSMKIKLSSDTNVTSGICSAYDMKTYIISQQASKGSVNKTILLEALNDLEIAKQGISLDDYYKTKIILLQALDQKENAAKVLDKYAKNDPDSTWILHTYFSSLAEASNRGGTIYADRYLNRNIYDGTRLGKYAHYHIRWGGSPILGIRALELAQEYSPENFDKSLYAGAYSQLGDHGKKMEMYLNGTRDISASERYVSWYKTAREEAQTGSTIVDIDTEKVSARIVHPDGKVQHVKHHPISGKLSYVKIGAAYIKAEYSEDGRNLQRISNSAQQEITLTYNEKNQIVKMTSSSGEALSFIYNNMGKPIDISVKGIGSILVTYDTQGEILTVKSKGVDEANGNEDHLLAMRVTKAFQELLSIIKPFSGNGIEVNSLPLLPYTDVKHDELQDSFDSTYDTYLASFAGADQESKMELVSKKLFENYANAGYKYTQYLVDHISDLYRYENDAKSNLESLITESIEYGDMKYVAQGIKQWHSLMFSTREEGIDENDWQQYQDYIQWLDISIATSKSSELQHLRVALETKPLKLLASAQWLPKSYLMNPGYWRHFSYQDIMVKKFSSNPEVNTVYKRTNGDILLGSEKGLSLYSLGYWNWFGFDILKKSFSENISLSQLDATSNILSLAEDASSNLWVGTANGLLFLQGESYRKQTEWIKSSKLASKQIKSLAKFNSGVLVGTGKGLYQATYNGKVTVKQLADFSDQSIHFMKNFQDIILIGTNKALYLLSMDGKEKILVSGLVQDAHLEPVNGNIFYLKDHVLYELVKNDDDTFTTQKVYDQHNIHKSLKINGLSDIQIDKKSNTYALTVMTDMGLSIWHDDHFENFSAFGVKNNNVDVKLVSENDGMNIFVTSEGIYLLETNAIINETDNGQVYDILTDNEQKITYIAYGNKLNVVLHNAVEKGSHLFSYIKATHLAMTAEGNLICNDSRDIMIKDKNSSDLKLLFDATPGNIPDDFGKGSIKSILLASNNDIWVTSGPSLFHWHEGNVTEYSTFKDHEKFPAASQKLSTVYETLEGKIRVIASDEGHLTYNGRYLSGGVLEYDNNKFKRISDVSKSTFVNSYTKINDKEAIAGTLNGFYYDTPKSYEQFDKLNNSYKVLANTKKQLYLSTKGSLIGEDLYLFGTASGIVGYKKGIWFYPDRINWMLPEYNLHNYGARTVHALSSDKFGNIYAGTDRGLLIYKNRGNNAQSFFIDNDLAVKPFEWQEESKLLSERDDLLSTINKDSAVSKKIKELQQIEQKIDKSKDILGKNSDAVNISSSRELKPDNTKKKLMKLERLYKKRLHSFERRYPMVYQLLDIKPYNLLAMSKIMNQNQLIENDIIVQYMATKDKLYINLLTKDRVYLKEVDVAKEELEIHLDYVLKNLEKSARSLGTTDKKTQEQLEKNTALLQKELAILYDYLIKPIQHDLEGHKHVLLSLNGKLSYLPFETLVSNVEPLEYAVEKYIFGYVPTIYFLSLIVNNQTSYEENTLIFGNPSLDLLYAEKEAEMVFDITRSDIEPFLRDQATFENLKENADTVRIIHISSHGKFTKNGTFLKFNDRVISSDAFYDMNNGDDESIIDLVFLSACESAREKNGMEYASLTRSLAHIGANNIIASMWSVDDYMTYLLTEKFYKSYIEDGDDIMISLAKAKRAMIKGDKIESHPSSWGAFISYGKP